jgi:hypothetical protein
MEPKPIDISEWGEQQIPLARNEQEELIESSQFKQIQLFAPDFDEAMRIYQELKALEQGEFKESQMRDSNGELVIMWHGSPRKFDTFNPNSMGEFRWKNKGMHFCSEKSTIHQYSEKAEKSLSQIVAGVARQHFIIPPTERIPKDQFQKAIGIYNKIIEDIRENGRDSQYYVTTSKPTPTGEWIPSSADAIVYMKRQFGADWALEIFNGKLPTKDNTYFDESSGVYIGNDLGKYKYATILNIENPFRLTSRDFDSTFKMGEKAHEEQGTDGTIIFHKEGIFGYPDGNALAAPGLIPNTEGSYSAAVFDPDKIKIIGVIND